MARIRLTRRRGMTIIEVMFAVVILSGVMLALSRFGQAFSRANRDAATLMTASDLATARADLVRGFGNYAGLAAAFDGEVETSATVTANPSMAGYDGFTRTTQVLRFASDTADVTSVTVTVTSALLSTPVRKTVVIAAF